MLMPLQISATKVRDYTTFLQLIVLKLLIFFPQKKFCKVQVQIKCSTSKLNFEHTNVLKYIKNVFISITFTCNPVSPQ